jgi:hypothetical protein
MGDVAVPVKLWKPHPVVAGLRDDKCQLAMPPKVRSRALRIFQGLIDEALRRGYEVREHPVQRQLIERHWIYGEYRNRYARQPEGFIDFVIDGHSFLLEIKQDTREANTTPEQLMLSLPRVTGRRMSWADRKRWVLEDVLGQVLAELESRAEEETQRHIELERVKAERHRRWYAAMEQARRQATQAYYAEALRQESQRWRQAQQLGEYCAALEQRIETSNDEDPQQIASARHWLAWARAYADSLHPLTDLPSMPEIPEFEPRDLQPFLNGRSPWDPG